MGVLNVQYRISHAQNREDFLIAAFFPDVSEGHYVDVGAADPEQYSVTKLFYDRGWNGINVEPIPELAERLRAARARDITVQAALGASDGTAILRQYSGSGLSTIKPELMDTHAAQGTPETDDFHEYPIPVTTLDALLRAHPLPHVHFLKIDVEGSEYDVLSGSDWDEFRPELICIETDHMMRDWMPLMAAAGYEQVFHDGLNAYLLAAEARARFEHFRYPQAVLSAPVLVTPEVGVQLSHVDDLWDRTQRLTEQTEQLTEQALQLTEQVRALTDDVEIRDAALAAERSVSALYATREAETAAKLHATEGLLAEILNSQSWRYTYPIRRLVEILKARLPRRLLRRVWHRVRPAVQAARAPTAKDAADLSPDGADILDRLRAQVER